MLLNKCSLKVWKNLLKQDMNNNNNYSSDSESDSKESYNEEEKEFILKNQSEYL